MTTQNPLTAVVSGSVSVPMEMREFGNVHREAGSVFRWQSTVLEKGAGIGMNEVSCGATRHAYFFLIQFMAGQMFGRQ
jgi:hypothetical protein